jgi:hypothetical protein
MVRQDTTFGPIATGQIEVDCSVPLPEVPNVFDVVQAVAAEYGYLLEINTFESCGEFIQRVLMTLDDPDWGHVGKTAGEMQHTPASFEAFYVEEHLITGFSHDVIYHRPSDGQVDIIIAAAANSDPNPEIWQTANIGWDVIPREHYRDNNPWIPAVPLEGEGAGGGAVLGPGQSIGPDGFRRSTDGRFELRYQGDGNLVLTHLGVGTLWTEDASINNPGSLTLELDGNLTIRNGGGQVVWTSETAGNPDASLHVQNDGNVVLYANGSDLWSTGTCCH